MANKYKKYYTHIKCNHVINTDKPIEYINEAQHLRNELNKVLMFIDDSIKRAKADMIYIN